MFGLPYPSRGLTLARAAAAVALSLASVPTIAGAEEIAALPSPLKPDDVLSYARGHRAEITAAKARAAAALQVAKIVTALPDPMVMVSVDHLPFKLDGINASFMVQQEFPLSGILGARGRAAEADGRAFAADAKTVSLDVEYQALGTYLMLVELQRMAAIVDEQITIARQIVAVTRARLAGAEGGAADVLRAELDVSRLDGERKTLAADTNGAAGMLDAALGRAITGTVPTCALVAPAADPPALTTLVTRAMDKRPEVTAMKERIARASSQVDVMNAMYTPMAFVRVGTAYTMSDGPGVMLLVGVTVPLWREKLGAGVSEAKSMAAMAGAELAAMKTMIEGDLAGAREAVVAARIRLETARDKLVPLAKRTVELMIVNYGTGQTPLVSVLDAVRVFREVRMEEAVADVRLSAAWARLGRAAGIVRVGA